MSIETEDQAYFDGRRDERIDARIEAFAAIRRAAAVARICDEFALKYRGIDRDATQSYSASARSIREAIRAAIVSEKT